MQMYVMSAMKFHVALEPLRSCKTLLTACVSPPFVLLLLLHLKQHSIVLSVHCVVSNT